MSATPAWLQERTVRKLVEANPMHGNPLRTRADLGRAASDMIAPLLPLMSESRARIRIGVGGAHYSSEAAEMESFARPLWALAPLVAGGIGHPNATDWAIGLMNGTDADHPDYWGDVNRFDQRMVEMAGLSLGILLAPDTFWTPMPEAARARTAMWLRWINAYPPADNNWLFFRVLTNLALRSVGEHWDEGLTRAALDRIEQFHIEGGHYRDGTWYQLDYYTPMGMHFYGLIIAQLVPDLFPDLAQRYRERARTYAQDFQHWFAGDGAAVPFGRSMTYRYAQGAFWAACAFAGEEVLPWGRIKGLLMRHLRWWADRPVTDRDGILTIGYGYPNLLMSEAYNAPGSPYWGLKSFLPLALGEDHPFWTAEEEAPDALPTGRHLCRPAGTVTRRAAEDALMLTGGQDGREHRYSDAKYGRFAYSSAFGFSVASDAWGDRVDRHAVDCGLSMSRDGLSWLSRATITEAGIDGDMAWGRWAPDGGLTVDSWLDLGPEGWHVRLHRVVTDVPIELAEGGFAIDRAGDGHLTPDDWITEASGEARVRTRSALSWLLDLTGGREGRIMRAAPNTNLLYPRTFFPRLSGRVEAGETWIATAVMGLTDPDATPVAFELPETARALLTREGVELSGWRGLGASPAT
ncbi:DUF2264 domain-containing protein [Pelagovum pacificum]|uniref:DUF2264 domain-containing protein n=1 Tax=Pelagovum pacificum TaxID=2588711 RepID=A0A5C5GFL8_9RHOB|nr:DUF2264 domain-containing protein [Pelagovum pacificum]QQA43379.1 DUF2264 domain-containing protein [Pelagovum pacificum]TNY33483.1 DUF2264 domain-containing protein [Pelagovum pacificum]